MSPRRPWLWFGLTASLAVLALAAVLKPPAPIAAADQRDTTEGGSLRAPVVPWTYDPADERFLVHEWGTFTSFAGSDGVKLEFRPLVENDLPPFVFNRSLQAGVIPLEWMLGKRSYALTMQRMETPVTYFYTTRERDVQVKVRFPEGLLTEFYPPVQGFSPPLSDGEKQPRFSQSVSVEQPLRSIGELPEQKDSELDWGTLTLIPAHKLRPDLVNSRAAAGVLSRLFDKLLPRSANHFDYYFARETDSAYIHRFLPPPPPEFAPSKPHGDFFEKFLFYRGIGNFQLPLTLEALGEDRFVLTNHGDVTVEGLFLTEFDKAYNPRFIAHPRIAAKERIELRLPSEALELADLVNPLREQLIAQGLFEKEADAMIATWRSSWFGEEGTRLFYLLPQSETDRILPLHVQPTPDETVRVMVGRLEVITPERERRLEQLLKEKAAAQKQQVEVEVAPESETALEEELANFERFAEPALVRVRDLTTDPAVKAEAERQIDSLETRSKD